MSETAARQEYFRLGRLPENNRKTEAELWAMVNENRSKTDQEIIGDDFMNRFLIFLFFFPAIASASFYAVLYILTGAAQDSGLGPVFMYLVFIVPGLLVALLDWLAAKSSVPPVIVTTLLTYGLTVLAMAWALGPSKQILALGLIGAIPSAVCSWLSDKPKESEDNA
jgi:hypothetical protein